MSAADLFSTCRCSWHLLILQLIFHLLSLLNYKTNKCSVPRKLYLLHGRYTMMGITHVGLFTAGGIYGSVVSPPPSYWFPPIAPSLISPTTLGLFSSDPNNHWDEPQGRRLCSLSLHFQHHSRISIVITIILILPPFCNSNPPYSSNLALASCPSPHLLGKVPSCKISSFLYFFCQNQFFMI